MAGRIMVIQRKGATPTPSAAPDEQDDAPDAADSGDDSGESDNDVATCPNCACEFDDETGDVVKKGKPVEGGPVSSEYDKAGKAGPDLPLPDIVPDKQAPAGEESLAALLGPLLAAGR